MSVFRPKYRVLSDAENYLIAEIKGRAEELHTLLCFNGTTPMDARGQREFALARTKLEESVMWAVKAITG